MTRCSAAADACSSSFHTSSQLSKKGTRKGQEKRPCVVSCVVGLLGFASTGSLFVRYRRLWRLVLTGRETGALTSTHTHSRYLSNAVQYLSLTHCLRRRVASRSLHWQGARPIACWCPLAASRTVATEEPAREPNLLPSLRLSPLSLSLSPSLACRPPTPPKHHNTHLQHSSRSFTLPLAHSVDNLPPLPRRQCLFFFAAAERFQSPRRSACSAPSPSPSAAPGSLVSRPKAPTSSKPPIGGPFWNSRR